ncbi:MAG: hypothetical protein NZM31_15425 [Gemmatales bacterium]|nr:hypothetical protein [Gemmatales bacterium]MDW8388387.1 hypothetical protein [Gemmatales bacterium]
MPNAEALGNIAVLADLYRRPDQPPSWLGTSQNSGRLFIWQIGPEGHPMHRRSTILAVLGQLTLLVQDFQASSRSDVELPLNSSAELAGSSLRYSSQLEDGTTVGVHLLGDYLLRREGRHRLVLRQRAQYGRFLVAVTADPTAWVRPASGWCVEMRSADVNWSLLHSNHSRKLRPVGPVRTDGRFALVKWPNVPCVHLAEGDDPLTALEIAVLEASSIHLDLRENRPPPAPDWVI